MFEIFVPKVSITNTQATLVYVYGEQNIDVLISIEESEILRDIFAGKRLWPNILNSTPSCGFSENISVKFEDIVFLIACDTCPSIGFSGRYFDIKTADREIINQIFEKYGGAFPCL